jgi:Leucine-rich repeat (LRR) protein
MAKIISILIGISLLTILVGCSTPKPMLYDGIFRDKSLAYRIGLYFPDGHVQIDQLEQFTEIFLPAVGIKNITGLEYFINLKKLDLADNEITDVSPLAGLTKLELLILEDNRISDVTPLSKLTNLNKLNLDGNPITDLSPIKELPVWFSPIWSDNSTGNE